MSPDVKASATDEEFDQVLALREEVDRLRNLVQETRRAASGPPHQRR
jgi:hypothetical protein